MKNLSKKYKGKTSQEIQDDIFRRMSADRKLEVASSLRHLAMKLFHSKGNMRGVRAQADSRLLEILILSKLDWYQQSESSRHLEDIGSIFKISGLKLDKKYLQEQSKRQGNWQVLKKLMNI